MLSANDDPNTLLMVTRVRALIQPVDPRPAGLQLSDPRVAADLVILKTNVTNGGGDLSQSLGIYPHVHQVAEWTFE